jgi:hypothetical protein
MCGKCEGVNRDFSMQEMFWEEVMGVTKASDVRRCLPTAYLLQKSWCDAPRGGAEGRLP